MVDADITVRTPTSPPPDLPVDPDAAVLALVRQGKHERALRLLMDRYGDMIYRYCREALGDRTRADDVHQKVFIQAHRDLARFEGRAQLKTWLLAIAHHRVIDELRAAGRERRHVEHDDDADLATDTPSAGESIDDERLREALVACVAELPDEIRDAVLLRYQQGLTFEAMAEICDDKPGTLQARVARALTRLRACIERRTGRTPPAQATGRPHTPT